MLGPCASRYFASSSSPRIAGGRTWAAALRKAFAGGRIPGTLVLAEPGPIRLWMYRWLFRLPQPERLVVILHGTEVHSLPKWPHRRVLFRQLLADADVIGVVSSAVGGMVEAVFPEAAPKLVRVPGAVRADWRQLPPPAKTADSGIADILQVGRLHPRKGQGVLVEAMGLLPADRLEQLQVRLIGPVSRPSYLEAIKARVRELDLPVRVEDALSDDALKEAYCSARVLVMPSHAYRDSIEGLGLALLEAQHFGCPVIGSGIGGIPEALLDGETGLLVPPGDPNALADALQRLLDDPATAARMGQAGAAFVRKAFSWQQNVHRLGLV